MSFQQCPKCKGSGLADSGLPYVSGSCWICRGFGVINEQTGQPLYEIVTTTTSGTTGTITKSTIDK